MAIVQYWDENLQQALVRDATPYEEMALSESTLSGTPPLDEAQTATPEQLRLALAAAGMSDDQINAFFAAASSL